MEFLELTLEWKLVTAFQQNKGRFACKGRTHEWDRMDPASAQAAATEAGGVPAPGCWELVRGLAPPASGGRRSRAVGTQVSRPLASRGGGGALRSCWIPGLNPCGCSLLARDRFWERSAKRVDLNLPLQNPPKSILVQVMDKNSRRITLGEERDSRKGRQGYDWSCKVGCRGGKDATLLPREGPGYGRKRGLLPGGIAPGVSGV